VKTIDRGPELKRVRQCHRAIKTRLRRAIAGRRKVDATQALHRAMIVGIGLHLRSSGSGASNR
jgi:hypothetical protein